MFLTIGNSFLAFWICYRTSNSRWRPKWLPKVVKFEKKSYISQKIWYKHE
jgi:hypothetical protein